ncbi:MAG: 50S ribosomal protein L3 N(5)-glutamine methyltransferase [Casimicrobiaceae bacterium]
MQPIARGGVEAPPEDLVTVLDWWRFTVSELTRAGAAFGQGTVSATDDAAFLVLGGLDLPLGALEPFANARLTAAERAHLYALLAARTRERKPTAYVLGFTELAGQRFHVNPNVLIPRSYLAELLVVDDPPWLDSPPDRILDMCTGSGCLAVLAAQVFPEAEVVAVDLSAPALDVAQENIALHGFEERVSLRHGDGLSAVSGERFDLILCNPPYVTAASMDALPPEFRWEPAMALAAGEDGNDFLHGFLPALPEHLSPHGVALVDIGHNRKLVEAAFPDLPFVWLATEGTEDGVFLLRRGDL